MRLVIDVSDGDVRDELSAARTRLQDSERNLERLQRHYNDSVTVAMEPGKMDAPKPRTRSRRRKLSKNPAAVAARKLRASKRK